MVVPSAGAWALLMAAAVPPDGNPPAPRDDAVEAVRLNLAVGEQCAEITTFWGQVRARTDRVRAAAIGEQARVFSVSAALDHGEAKGRLVITEPGGEETVRELDAASCDEVVAGLALIAAIAVDPEARTEPLKAIPASPPVAAPEQTKQPVPPASTTDVVPVPPTKPREVDDAKAASTPRVALVLQGQARPMQGAPTFYGASASIEVDTIPTATFSPLVRFSGSWTGGIDAIHMTNGSARFEWLSARLALCPVRFPRRSSGRVDVCAHVEAGALSGEGSEVERPQTAARLWTAAGGALRGQVDLVGALFVEAEGWVDFGLHRPSFQFRPAAEVLHAPVFVPGVAIGAGGRF